MVNNGSHPSKSLLLFVAGERAITDGTRIKAFDKEAAFSKWFIGLPLLALGAAIALFVIFFQITDLANVAGIPRIPALGLLVLPALAALGSGISTINGVLQSPLRQYSKMPNAFRVLKAIITRAEKSWTGMALHLTILHDPPDGLEKGQVEYREKIKLVFWDETVSLPREARIIYSSQMTGEKALLAVLKG
jgi:hypothetical protein